MPKCPICGVNIVRKKQRKMTRHCSLKCAWKSMEKPDAIWPSGGPSRNPKAQREYHRRYRDKNRTRINEIARRSRVNNKQAIKFASQIRSAQTRRDGISKEEVAARMLSTNGRCVYCGDKCDRLEVEHIEPVSRGGSFEIDNIVPACRWCNASKGNKDVADWLAEEFGIAGLARATVLLERGYLPDYL